MGNSTDRRISDVYTNTRKNTNSVKSIVELKTPKEALELAHKKINMDDGIIHFDCYSIRTSSITKVMLNSQYEGRVKTKDGEESSYSLRLHLFFNIDDKSYNVFNINNVGYISDMLEIRSSISRRLYNVQTAPEKDII